MNQRDKREGNILSASLKLFAEKGYAETTIRDISSAVGCNQAMIYYYFRDKQTLLFHAMCSNLNALINKARYISELEISPHEKLTLLVKEHVSSFRKNKDSFTVANTELRNLSEQNRKEFMIERDEYQSIIRRVITDGIENGQFRAIDPSLASIYLLILLNSLSRWYKSDGQYSLEEIGNQIQVLFTR